MTLDLTDDEAALVAYTLGLAGSSTSKNRSMSVAIVNRITVARGVLPDLSNLLQPSAEHADVEAARQALNRLSLAEQAKLFREVGRCSCAAISNIAKQSPGAAVGAVVGGIIGGLLSTETKKRCNPRQLQALEELDKKTISQIQVETAYTWAYRAWAAKQFAAVRKNQPLLLQWMHDATEYEHEALEHAALTGRDDVLREVRQIISAQVRPWPWRDEDL